MYVDEQPMIAEYGNRSAEHTYQVYKFVVATINRKFAMVPALLADRHGPNSVLLSDGTHHIGFTTAQIYGLNTVYAGRDFLYRTIHDLQDSPQDLMRYFVTLPNISIVKSGFLAQLLTGHVGCIDVHNQRQFNLPKSIMRMDARTSEKSVVEKLFQYCGICAQLGTAFLWDNWCATLASKYAPHNTWYPWQTAQAVSTFHLTCLGLA